MTSSALTGNTSGLASATSPGLVGITTQTFAGKKTLDGGALIKGDTSGSIISSTYLGEFLGTQSSGTNGSAYYVNSTTAVTALQTAICSTNVNKGIYFCSYAMRAYQTDGAVRAVNMALRIGGTAVTPTLVIDSQTNLYFSLSWSVPIIITADSTAVAIYAQIQSLVGSSAGNQSMISFLRVG